MQLPSKLLEFFYLDIDNPQPNNNPKKLSEFTNKPENVNTINILEVQKIIQKLKLEGYLLSTGFDYTENPITNEKLVSFNYDEAVAKYGSYDFLFYGFKSITDRFSESVRPVVITKKDDSIDIGTSFLLGNHHTLVTAKHVVEEAKLIQIKDLKGNFINAEKIVISKNKNIDIAFILVSEEAFKGIPAFNSTEHKILEEIITIGYPPIPGFDAIQIFEQASVNNSIKFSKGQIIAEDKAYIDQIDYFLINAKVKGGNSGSPVINKLGNVLGMVVQIPIDSEDSSKLDSLGYGIVTPRAEILKLINEVSKSDVINLEVLNSSRGLYIK